MRVLGLTYELSTQQITSCKLASCDTGGSFPKNFEYVISAGGLETESNYPYTSGTTNTPGTCTIAYPRVISITSYNLVGYYPYTLNEDAMAEYVQSTGPLGKTICADSLQNYGSGILSICNQSPLNHIVQVVGKRMRDCFASYNQLNIMKVCIQRQTAQDTGKYEING